MKPRLALAGAALALFPLLAGCVAVAALPMLAGSAMFAGGNVKIRAATPRPKGTVTLVDSKTPAPGKGLATSAGGRDSAVTLTGLTALPPPDSVTDAADPWKQFVRWSLEQAPKLAEPGRHRSALYETGSSLALPRLRDCKAQVPAVVIDIDTGGAAWSPGSITPAPGLAGNLARLREAGVVLLWLTTLPAARVGELAAALRDSGLDPDGADPLLLVRGRDDRKQALREDANRDVCVIAIAGDRKSDFDELFDYLRNPADAQSFDTFLGAGWFLVPPPLQ